MFTAEVKITLKKTVADPQGLTVQHALESLGFTGLAGVRMGKFIILQLNAEDEVKAKVEAEEMSHKLLANLIIEDFSIEVYPESNRGVKQS
ncbi:MAG: phosphoribosylformylglycinamidine synthase subunit PurS [Candidatus Margulisbacteria bacterium]|nr:phosphoribosylformylglycinamidine synthase subunit PurS [Candidatus Margulisiibacteriota bacterium]